MGGSSFSLLVLNKNSLKAEGGAMSNGFTVSNMIVMKKTKFPNIIEDLD